MSFPTKFEVTITYKNLTGHSSNEEEILREVQKYKREELIQIFCLFNHNLDTYFGGVNDETHKLLINAYCPPEIVNKIELLPKFDGNPRYLFHRLQLLSLIKRAILSNGQGQEHPYSIFNKGDLWKLLSMANEHIQKSIPPNLSEMERELAKIGNFISATEYSRSGVRHRSKLARATWLYRNFSENFKTINIEKILYENTGLTIEEYHALCVGISTYYFTDASSDKTQIDASKFFLNSQDWFKNCSIEMDKVDKFLSDISREAEDFKIVFEQKNSGLTDFTPFQKWPLIRHGTKYLIIDQNFLIDKIESGIFWKVHQFLPRNEQDSFHRLWGKNFQDYVNWLLNLSCENVHNKVLVAPKFSGSHDEVCDSIIICRRSAVFIECKGGLLTTEAKYGGDPKTLLEELKKKLIGNDANAKRKGVTQLAHSINTSFEREHPREIEGLDYSSIDKVFPILLLKEDFGECIFVTHFLNRFFIPRKIKPKIITPLFCLGIETLEEISGYLKEVSIVSLLEAWYKNDKPLLGSFLAVKNSVIKRLGKRQNELLILEEDKLWELVTTKLFPEVT